MTVLLTGITGLVGCHVAIALLQRGIRVIALARGGDGLTAESRVMRTVSAYPGWKGRKGPLSNMLVVEGNMLSENCGMDSAMCDMLKEHVDVVINCAGAISFSAPGDPVPELRVNTEGLRSVVALTERLRCGRMIHVSTAYVDKGRSNGEYRTEYERTKHDGEAILESEATALGIDAIIVRPSIVTGDVEFGFTPVFNGVYPFFRFGFDHWEELRDTSLESRLPPSFSNHASVNLVPADILGSVIARLAVDWPEHARIFTLINPREWPIVDLLSATAAYFHLHMPPSAGMRWPSPTAKLALQAEANVLFKLYEPYALASPLCLEDSESAVLSETECAALANHGAWFDALLNWGMSVGWKRIGSGS
jgi:nucleoside-diphosphate-sugar epimerase